MKVDISIVNGIYDDKLCIFLVLLYDILFVKVFGDLNVILMDDNFEFFVKNVKGSNIRNIILKF